MRLLRALLAQAALALAVTVAPGAVGEPEAPARGAAPPRASGGRRAVPDYDGRGEPPATTSETLVWIPRVVLFPVWLVTEYVVRRPIGFLIVQVERLRVVPTLAELFTFGPGNDAGIVPTAFYEFEFRPSAGLYFFWDEALFSGNQLRVHAATGGPDWLRLTVTDRVPLGGDDRLRLRFEASTRSDWLYHGLGPDSEERDAAFYQASWLDPSATFRVPFGHLSRFEGWLGWRRARFAEDCCADDGVPTLGARVGEGRLQLPPGFEEGYSAQRSGARLALDSRSPRPAPGHGVRLDAQAEQSLRTQGSGARGWVRWGGTLGAFLDLTEQNRVVSLSLHASFADPLGRGDVPFLELPELGGDYPLRGFRPGRLRGESTVAATLGYRYPIWSLLDGTLQAGVGNAFGRRLEGLRADRLRASVAFGITTGERDHAFDLLVGTGTSTFEQGASLDELRVVLGGTQHF